MYKKNSQDISRQDFQQPNKNLACYYQHPSPQYPAKATKFDTLVYVATIFNQKPKTSFNHSEASPFRTVALDRK